MKNYRLFYCLIAVIVLTFIFAPLSNNVKAQRPESGTAKTANKENPVPKDWTYVFDKVKGFGFSVPKGTTGGLQTINGLDITALKTAAPLKIGIMVLAYKDKTLTKEDLLNDDVAFIQAADQKVTPGELKAESGNYALADAEAVAADGTKKHLRILVGTDVTDNYIMIILADPETFKNEEETIDTIWGSFEMWSGKS